MSSKSFQKPNRQRPGGRWSRLVSANNYQRGNSSARWREEECVHGEQKRRREKKERSSWRRQSVISLVIDHRAASYRDWPSGRGCGRNTTRRLARNQGEKIFRREVQCLSDGMIYRNDALLLVGYVFPPIRWHVRETLHFCASAIFETGNNHSVRRRTAAHGHHVKEICFL